jgi:shikimate kinase
MNPAPNLALVGPMGAGKSALGKRLAARLGLAFVDADRHVEAASGTDIPTIFALEGEAGFRRREAQALAELLAGEGRLVATGGGAVLDAGSRALLQSRAFVVYLKLGVPQQLERLARDRSRPLLATGDREATLHALAAVRNPLYEALADQVVDADALPADAAARRLATQLRSGWQRQAVA